MDTRGTGNCRMDAARMLYICSAPPPPWVCWVTLISFTICVNLTHSVLLNLFSVYSKHADEVLHYAEKKTSRVEFIRLCRRDLV